jgi:hypothetical protein
MKVQSSHLKRGRIVVAVVAAALALGMTSNDAVAGARVAGDTASAPTVGTMGLMLDERGEPSQLVTTRPDGSYSYDGPATPSGASSGATLGDHVYVGTPYFVATTSRSSQVRT